jgi:hypothetical protein
MSLTFDEERALKIFESMIQVSLSGFKLLALLNGGAAVALLAYLGHIAGSSTVAAAVVPPDLRVPMGFYIGGLVCCGVATALSYRTQFILWNEALDRTHVGMHRSCLVGAAIMCGLSLLAFAVGSFLAAASFR